MWEVFKDWIFDVIQFFFNFCGDWGMAILIVTIIFRVILIPLMYKQAKSSYQMQKIQPYIQSIQTRFADDPLRQQQEIQKLQASAKFNPLAGRLPMLLQMPIFVALFQVLRELGNRPEVSDYSFYNIIPDLVISPSTAISQSLGTFVPYFILLLIFAGATFLPMMLQQMNTPQSPQRKQTMIMGVVMTLFMLWIGWGSPAGVLLFWGASSVIAVLVNQLTLRHFKKQDKKEAEDMIEVAPVEVTVTRKEKKPRPKKKR